MSESPDLWRCPQCGRTFANRNQSHTCRASFAAFMPRLHWLDGHVVLAERLESPRFTKVEVYLRR
ncbi:MAG TPA: hypothetical protein VFG33_15570 [Kribbella sp.]|uniref:hypothetical protein n=1 Tax=Kribbella sp. TaxID=1871183 RepID=UPI002D79E537|nr:hypothetical protein [Kribbella sp.]HET6294801.1 hypothetical protein [Kribbella sp.]